MAHIPDLFVLLTDRRRHRLGALEAAVVDLDDGNDPCDLTDEAFVRAMQLLEVLKGDAVLGGWNTGVGESGREWARVGVSE